MIPAHQRIIKPFGIFEFVMIQVSLGEKTIGFWLEETSRQLIVRCAKPLADIKHSHHGQNTLGGSNLFRDISIPTGDRSCQIR